MRTERLLQIGHRQELQTQPVKREKLDPQRVGVMLLSMQGEGGLSLHEPIGIEAISGRMQRDLGIKPAMHDVQPQLYKKGKIDTEELADTVYTFAQNAPGDTAVIGISSTIYSWEYTKSLLLKLGQREEEQPSKKNTTIVIGNAIPTYTNLDLLRKEIDALGEHVPPVVFVKGDGEDAFMDIVTKVSRGESVQDVTEHKLTDLSQYAMPDRSLTSQTWELGGSIKIESSRGCDFGACTFCSRDKHTGRGGKDYRKVPEHLVVAQSEELVKEYNVTHFELADEEAFGGDMEATRRLVSVWKSHDWQDIPPEFYDTHISEYPQIPFAASLRVDLLRDLDREGLVEQLQEIGLNKVFLGVEGGSDRLFQQMAKRQTVEGVREALTIVKERELNIEMGYITFSWRMDKDMLRENIEFLSEPEVFPHVSSLFNELAVRAGTIDEAHLRQYARDANNPHPETEREKQRKHKYRMFRGYDPDKAFSINDSVYKDVPYLDHEVGKIAKEAQEFAKADASLYYSIKSINRAGTLPEAQARQAKEHFIEMKKLHLEYLRHAVGLEPGENLVAATRKALVEKMQATYGIEDEQDHLDSVRREIKMFLSQEKEREMVKEHNAPQMGALAVCVDEKNRLMLVRPRNETLWSFPGGNREELSPGTYEDTESTVRREVREELGVEDVAIEGSLPTVIKKHHVDATTGERDSLTLDHLLVRFYDNDQPDIMKGDGEIVDIVRLRPEEIIAGKVAVQKNVQFIAHVMHNDIATHARTVYHHFDGE